MAIDVRHSLSFEIQRDQLWLEATPTVEWQPLHLSVRPAAPFDFALTARVLRRSTRNVIDHVDEDGTWSRVVVVGQGPALVRGHQHGDTVTFAGEVTGKRVEDGKKLVDCRVRGTNQLGELVCLCDATMVMPR